MPPSDGTRARSPFAEPQYRWIYSSNMLFFMGMESQRVARFWLVYDMTAREFDLGLMGFVIALPMLAVAPLGGSIADRVDRRNLIRFGQAVITTSELGVLGLLFAGVLEFWHLLALAGLSGCMFPFIMPARNAIVANVVGPARLAQAMAFNMTGANATRVLGPALAGVAIGALGVELTFAMGVGFYIAAFSCLLPLRSSPPPPGARDESIPRNIADGFRYLHRERVVALLLVFGLVPMTLAMPFQNLLVVFSEEVWNQGPEGFGLLNALAGLGAITGSALVAWQPNPRRRTRRMVAYALAFGATVTGFALSPSFGLALVLIFAAYVFQSLFTTLNNTSIQVLIPDHVRGRVSSILMMSFSLPMLGTLPLGAFAEVAGAPTAVALASALAVAFALAIYTGSRSLRTLDDRMDEAMSR